MVQSKRFFVLASCFLSGAAALISFISLGTQEWVISDSRATVDLTAIFTEKAVKFGLFGGTYRQVSPIPATFDLIMTCLLDKNACALLCGETDRRLSDLESLYNGNNVNYDLESCPVITTNYAREGGPYPSFASRIQPRAEGQKRLFINAGVTICTALFLCLSAVVGVIACGLAVWNTAANPYQVYFSVLALYVYNAVAFFSLLLAIVLWGAMFAHTTKHYIPMYQTLGGDVTTEDMATLGYSYWINLASLFLYLASIVLLYVRDYLISKEPQVKLDLDDSTDPVIYLY